MATISASSTGISPAFSISAEELLLRYFSTVTDVDIDGVRPPGLGVQGGYSKAMELINLWYPWIDEKIVEPKYDGVCQYLGMISNRPTYIKDYHWIALARAVDYILTPRYEAMIKAYVGSVYPNSAPTPEGSQAI